jgi:hypothetical protein
LAGATNGDIIVDPRGKLGWGDTQAVDFDVTATDVSIDVIGLCPVPGFLDFSVRTPGGTMITPASVATEPNVQYTVKDNVAFYRIQLPALAAAPAGSHGGRWQAIFRLRRPGDVKRWLAQHREAWERLADLRQSGGLAYDCLVQTYSNLHFRAGLTQTALAPGSDIRLEAALTEYGVPLAGSATVWAEVTRPDGANDTVSLNRTGAGRFMAVYTTGVAGVYTFRVRAQGVSSSGYPFTREKLLSAGIIAGRSSDAGGTDDLIDAIGERDEQLCRLLACLLSSDVLDQTFEKRLREAGVHLDGIRRCVKRWCESRRRRAGEPKPATPAGGLSPQSARVLGDLLQKLTAVDTDALFATTAKPQPVEPPCEPKRAHIHPPGGHFPPVEPEDKPGEREPDKPHRDAGGHDHDHGSHDHDHGSHADEHESHEHGHAGDVERRDMPPARGSHFPPVPPEDEPSGGKEPPRKNQRRKDEE